MIHVPCSTFLYRGDSEHPKREIYRALTPYLDTLTEDELDHMRLHGQVVMVPILFVSAIRDMGLLQELYNGDVELLKADIKAGMFSTWESRQYNKIESEFDLVSFGYPSDHEQAINLERIISGLPGQIK